MTGVIAMTMTHNTPFVQNNNKNQLSIYKYNNDRHFVD